MNFAIIGAAGYIAPRHLRAVRDTGNTLVAALDPNDSIGLLDQYALDIRYFREFERFDRHLEKLRRGPEESRVHYVTICSPNYLHDAHCRFALRVGAAVICEKPLVINPWNLDALQEIEAETGGQINTVLQLRLHPMLMRLHEQLKIESPRARHKVILTYVTARGKWYDISWKGDHEKSGGIAMNIGVHFFDMLLWLFGPLEESRVYYADERRMAGSLELERAQVSWFLSVNASDLPFTPEPGKRSTYRSIEIDGQEIEFTEGFTDLHTRVYEETLAGHGFGIEAVRPSIDLTYRIRTADVSPWDEHVHPFVKRG
jgi:UDP-N-acetyl-2-amino-2-deoxyglucuronate dehydrogenase